MMPLKPVPVIYNLIQFYKIIWFLHGFPAPNPQESCNNKLCPNFKNPALSEFSVLTLLSMFLVT
jgi:hypothetical protein